MARGYALSADAQSGAAWFARLGDPLGPEDHRLARAYLDGLGLGADITVAGVTEAGRVEGLIRAPDWDPRWWDIEERERQRLQGLAELSLGRGAVLEQLTVAALAHNDAIRAAAARALGADDALARAAAGACALALHEEAIARLADAGDAHVFMRKCALFAAGRWPLGVVHQTFHLY